MEGFARWLVRRPAVVLAATVLLTAVLGAWALHVRIENSVSSVLPAGDPAVAYYAHVRELFGSDDVGVIGVRAPDLFVPTTLDKIDRVTGAIGKIEGVERVLSITNAKDPGADLFTPPPLLPRMPPTPEDIDALKRKLATTPLFRKNLVATDGRGAAINVFFKPLTDAQYLDLHIDDRIADVLAREHGPERFYYTGAAHVKQAAVDLMRRDLFRFTPVALALVVLVLWISFRTKRGVILPLTTVVIALVWTLGAMVLAGKSISIGTFVLPPLLLVVGSSYSIHVMARYYEQVELGVRGPEVVVRAFQRVALPLSISALTNVIGFGSLMVSRIPAIWDLGFLAVIGIVCLTATSLTFLFAMLAIMPVDRRTAGANPWLVGLLRRLGARAYRSQRTILWGAAAVALLALAGATLIRVDSDFLYYFSPSAPVRRDTETINRDIVGSNPFYVVIEGEQPGLLKHWEVLKLIKELQQFLETLPGVTSSVSLVDYLEMLESGLNKSASGDLVLDELGNLVPAQTPRTFWEDPKGLEPLLKTVATVPETFKGVVTPDFSMASILVRTDLSGSRAVEQTLERIRRHVAEHFPRDIRVNLTGNLVLLTGTTSDIVTGQIKSLTLALIVIFVVMALMFLSVKIGFLAILPNVVAILLFFGVMGWAGILLNLGTSLIAAISLGLAVDSTIHYMARLNLELQGEENQQAAVARALRTVGVPIVYTTVALFLGFLTFAFSSFVPIQNFGILSGVTMATALGANLIVLPALLATTKIITLWDLVTVKLGKDPGRTIPLFAGLRPSQARVVVLMGQVKRFGTGEPIVRRGERGDEMYVIINGRTEVWAGQDHERKQVAELRRGDVFGEMALVRHDERSADVVAADQVEVLAVDERFLERIQRRYPRIASQVFLNLTRILSDRLERMNERFVALTRR